MHAICSLFRFFSPFSPADLHKYPFQGRLLLFFVPAMMIFIGEGVDRIMTIKKPTGPIVWLSLCVLLFLVPAQKAMSTLLNPSRLDREEARPVITYLSQHFQKGDTLYLYHHSKPAFKYYAKQVGLENVQTQIGIQSEKNWDKYVKELRGLQGIGRVWFLFSHSVNTSAGNEEKFFVHILNDMGKQIDSFKRKDASVYLYDLQSDFRQ